MAKKVYHRLNDELKKEFLTERAKGTITNDNTWLINKGLVIAKRLGVKNFKASSHWLYKFKSRNGLSKSASKTNHLSSTLANGDHDSSSSSDDELQDSLHQDNHTGKQLSLTTYQHGDQPSTSKPMCMHPNSIQNHSLNHVAAANCAEDDNSFSEQQMIVELSPDNMATMVNGEQTGLKANPVPKESKEEAIKAATTLIRYITLNTTDFDASSSSFLAMLSSYLNKLISSQPSTLGHQLNC